MMTRMPPKSSRRKHRTRSNTDRLPGNRLRRLLGILDLLGSGANGWTAGRTAKTFGISERRFHQDLKELIRCGFGFVSSRTGYHMVKSPLHLPITLTAIEALALLHPLRGTKDQRALAEQKLAKALPPE